MSDFIKQGKIFAASCALATMAFTGAAQAQERTVDIDTATSNMTTCLVDAVEEKLKQIDYDNMTVDMEKARALLSTATEAIEKYTAPCLATAADLQEENIPTMPQFPENIVDSRGEFYAFLKEMEAYENFVNQYVDSDAVGDSLSEFLNNKLIEILEHKAQSSAVPAQAPAAPRLG